MTRSVNPSGAQPGGVYTAISLFSGAMGLDIGLESTGRFTTLAAVEKVPAFCESIRKNRDAGRTNNPEMLVYDGDISDLDPAEVLEATGLRPGELDLLVGGPPCQSFSTTGRRGTVEDPRGTLLWQFLRFVEVMQPKFFLMENVRGLMSAALRHRPIADRPDKGGPPLVDAEMPGSVVRQLVEDLNGEYRLDICEVNAVNYGAPQLRERVLFLGNRLNHLLELPKPTHGMAQVDSLSPQGSLFASGEPDVLKPFRTLGDALEGLVDPDPVTLDFSPRKKSFLAMVPPGSNWRSLPVEAAQESMGKAYFAKGGRSGWWRRLTFELPSPTVVTMPNHASTSLCHPTETRALTLRECARIQEFPDDWEFLGSPSEQFAQVGNAVPVRLGVVAGEVLASALDEARSEKFKRRSGGTPSVRQIYLQSHVRTRKWFKDGRTFVWGEETDMPHYGTPKTLRTESALLSTSRPPRRAPASKQRQEK